MNKLKCHFFRHLEEWKNTIVLTPWVENWGLVGVTTKLILSQAMITTEKEAKKTNVVCDPAESLHSSSWNRRSYRLALQCYWLSQSFYNFIYSSFSTSPTPKVPLLLGIFWYGFYLFEGIRLGRGSVPLLWEKIWEFEYTSIKERLVWWNENSIQRSMFPPGRFPEARSCEGAPSWWEASWRGRAGCRRASCRLSTRYGGFSRYDSWKKDMYDVSIEIRQEL